MSKKIKIGNTYIGGGEEIRIQSMCNVKTSDVKMCTEQILSLEKAGCEIVRVAVPDMESAIAIEKIKENIHIPLVADIHFDYRLAIETSIFVPTSSHPICSQTLFDNKLSETRNSYISPIRNMLFFLTYQFCSCSFFHITSLDHTLIISQLL